MPINMLTPIVNKVLEMFQREAYAPESLNQSMVAVTKDSLRGMSEFMLVGSLIPASIMAGSTKAFEELSFDIGEHCDELLFASIEGARAVNVSLNDAVYGSCFQLLLSLSASDIPVVVEKLHKSIDQQTAWSNAEKGIAQKSLHQASKDIIE